MERQVLFFLNIKNEQFSAEKQHVKNISLADNPWLSNFVGDLLSLYGCLHAKYIHRSSTFRNRCLLHWITYTNDTSWKEVNPN